MKVAASNSAGIRMVLTFIPFDAPSIADKTGDFGEDCLNEVSSAAVRFGEERRKQAAAGVAFFLDTFAWRSKKKYLARRAKAALF